MARTHRMEHPTTGEVVWTDTPAAYDGWTETARGNRMPGDHEDKVGDRWKKDEAAIERKARLARLRRMHRDEFADHIVDMVIERLKAEGWAPPAAKAEGSDP